MTRSQYPSSVDYESNPYPVVAPQLLWNLGQLVGSFFDSLFQTLRKQHNLSQAGDSTVTWERLTGVDKTEQFTLGSIGRFVHPTAGLIRARYVKFVAPSAFGYSGVPVGYRNPTTRFAWEATNLFSDSKTNFTAGFCAAFVEPLDGQYGWIIIDGVNTQSLIFNGSIAPVVGQQLIWTASGCATDSGGALSFATVMTLDGLTTDTISGTGYWDCAPGTIRIHAR